MINLKILLFMCNLYTLIFLRDILHIQFFIENEQILPSFRIFFQNFEIRPPKWIVVHPVY